MHVFLVICNHTYTSTHKIDAQMRKIKDDRKKEPVTGNFNNPPVMMTCIPCVYVPAYMSHKLGTVTIFRLGVRIRVWIRERVRIRIRVSVRFRIRVKFKIQKNTKLQKSRNSNSS